jgi:hypothetical protein
MSDHSRDSASTRPYSIVQEMPKRLPRRSTRFGKKWPLLFVSAVVYIAARMLFSTAHL